MASHTGEANPPAEQQPIRAVLCGKTVAVGEKVTPLLLPQIQIIHFINSFEDAKANLPDLVAGLGPKSPSSNHIGTHDYSQPPRAVIFGRAFDPAHVKELNHLCRGMGSAPVAWIAGDPAATLPAQPGPDYAEKAAENVKRALARWRDAGSSDEDIVYY